MQVTPTTFTVADYCKAMEVEDIYPNREYQRSDAVWPPAARSYLIDTILHGYPIPKLSLAQKTDLKSRRTTKEIVDGQQRSQAILDFYKGTLRLTSKSKFSGKTYQTLEPEQQRAFLDYALSVDLFVGATAADIREVFRRINSYTVPLNPQEQRHACFQGQFKWFIVELTSRHAQTFVDVGVFKERQISRMSDAQLFTEIAMALIDGIQTYSKAKVDKFYERFDDDFEHEKEFNSAFDRALSHVLTMKSLHFTSMMKVPLFYTMVLAILHMENRFAPLSKVYDFGSKKRFNAHRAEQHLSVLAAAVESDKPPNKLKSFVDASAEGTNTIKTRSVRFEWCCRALDQENF